MEDQNGAPSESVVATPFSELISAWLDEGDRLDEKAIAGAASSSLPVETRARRILLLLRPALDRYRVVVLAGAGLIPFALFALTHQSAVPPVPVVAAATLARVATPPASPLGWPEHVAMAAEAPLPPPSSVPSAKLGGISEPAEAAPALPDLPAPDPRAALRPHRHHHHQAAKLPAPCGGGPCAVARPAPPGPPAGPVAVARPAAPSAPVGLVAVAHPAAPGAHPGPAAPPRSAPALRKGKGQPLR